MLLQHILLQLDGELVRLQNLRKVVAGLAKAPAIVRHLAPRLDKLRAAGIEAGLDIGQQSAGQNKPAPDAERQAELETAIVKGSKANGESAAAQPRRRGRPRKDPALAAVPRAYTPRASRHTEPTALSRSAHAGPVVVSAAALARERETRATAKAGTQPQDTEAVQAEVMPDTFARALAARWLSSASKA